MPLQQMTSQTLAGHTDERWFHSEAVTDATSAPLVIPSVGRDVAVAVVPGTSARIEYSLSSYAALEADTATWHAWPEGDVAEPAINSIDGSVSALRLVSQGASRWEVAL